METRFNRNVLCLTVATQKVFAPIGDLFVFNRNVLCLTVATKRDKETSAVPHNSWVNW